MQISRKVWSWIPTLAVSGLALAIAYKYVNPAPPNRIVITTGEDEGDYQIYAKLYQDIIKEDGVTLEIRHSSGATENLRRLQDPNSDVDAGFIQDGLGSADAEPDLSSLGSLYYEPIWVFYRAQPGKSPKSPNSEITRLSGLTGKRVAIGQSGGGTETVTLKLLKAAGVTEKNSKFVAIGWQAAASALQRGDVDFAFFLSTPDDPIIVKLFQDPALKVMNFDQAEAITRQVPFLHHLVLPHGAIDLRRGIPAEDINLVSPTATLVVKDRLHPALIYLLLKAAAQVHSEPGLFEKKNEFPIDKDYDFPLADEAKHFYKSGAPFWQRYLPFWLATLVDRFIIVMLPLFALLFPMVKLIPRFFEWRVKSRIFQRYGELKFLETQIKRETDPSKYAEQVQKLDAIEDRVNHMKIPLDFSEHFYVLREHIHFVRERLRKSLGAD